MKRAKIFVQNHEAGILEEIEKGRSYRFLYQEGYQGPPVSLTMPPSSKLYHFSQFPAFFDGLLPEGIQLQGLLRQKKIDADDHFEQLIAVGADLVGDVTVEALPHE